MRLWAHFLRNRQPAPNNQQPTQAVFFRRDHGSDRLAGDKHDEPA